MKFSIYTVIALWLWCAAAAGEEIPLVVTPEILQQNAHTATLQTPCNWDKDLGNVKVMGFYGTPESDMMQAAIEPTAKTTVGAFLQVTINPSDYTHEQRPLHHANVVINTTGKQCEGGFGFNPGNFTKPRR